jgi:integrase
LHLKRHAITAGSVTVPIYPTPSRGRPGYTVCWHLAGQRQRRRFNTLGRARLFAQAQAARLSRGETNALGVPPADLAGYLRAAELARSIARPLELVAAEAVEVSKLLSDHPHAPSLIEMARDWLRHHPARSEPRPVKEAVAALLDERRSAGRSSVHLDDLELRLGRFAEAFQCPIQSVRGADVADWLRALKGKRGGPLGLRSRNNYLMAVRTLFHFARDRGWITDREAALEAVTLAKAPAGKIQPYSPEEMTRLLRAAETHRRAGLRGLVPWLVLRAFAGVRNAEARRLKWADVHFESRCLVLDRGITKTAVRRMVPLHDAALAWLRPWRGEKGAIYSGHANSALAALCRAARVQIRHNGLRDSFISYRCAELGEVARVADESGNSPRKIAESYRELRLADGRVITADLAREWFNIRPLPKEDLFDWSVTPDFCHASVTHQPPPQESLGIAP